MTDPTTYRAPRRSLLWSEHLRASAETVAFYAALPALTSGPRGDGHRVLVLPGLLANDSSTAPLRQVLRSRGYRAHGWGLGTNIGPTSRITEGLFDRLQDLHDRDGAPVTLIGWSLGGLLSRELARHAPEHVRSVITLGSPLRLNTGSSVNASHASAAFHFFRPWHTDFFGGHEPEEERVPLTMPATSIYSRFDGIVPWQACLQLDGPQRENVEVNASHMGLGVHPPTIQIVLDRLAQPIGKWQPYAAGKVAA